jgi:hypothetical protein
MLDGGRRAMPAQNRYDLIFSSDQFNLSQPRGYFINDCCYGDDVARWLVERLRSRGCTVTEPDQEDWGWYFDVRHGQAAYFVGVGGASDDESSGNNQGEWRLMVQKHRTLRERLTRANLLDRDDAFLALLRDIIAAGPGLAFVGIE